MSNFRTIYEARSLIAIRMVNLIACTFFIAGNAFAWYVLYAPNHPHISSQSQVLWAAFIALAAALAPLLAWRYGRSMVARVALSNDGQRLQIFEPNFIAGTTPREVARQDIELQIPTAGDPAGEQTLAPGSIEVRVRHGRPFVVTFDQGAAQREVFMQALQR